MQLLKIIPRLSVDILMVILMLFSLAYQLTDNTKYELIGASIFILFIIHNALNWRWYAGLLQGRHSALRLASITINVLLLSVTLMLTISGIMNSHILFPLHQTDGYFATRQFHTLTGYWFLILTSVHLGMHWKMIIGVLRKMAGITDRSRIRAISLRIISALIVISGINSSFDRSILSKLTADYSFDYWNFDEFIIGFFGEYVSIMAIYVCATYHILKIFQRSAVVARSKEASCGLCKLQKN